MPDDKLTAALDDIRKRWEVWGEADVLPRLLAAVDRVLLLAEVWDGDSAALREQFARDVHPALASGHTEANALQQRAAETRAAIAAALLGGDGTNG